MRINPKERIGTIIRNFKILDYKKEQCRNRQVTYFLIRCLLCENNKWMSMSSVLTPDVKGCGCQRHNEKQKKAITSDLRGQIFERLTVIAPTEKREQRQIVWDCECSCGKNKQVATSSLTSGMVRSCGCLNLETSIEIFNQSKERLVVEGTNLATLTAIKPSTNTSGVKGVTWDKQTGKWRALIEFQGKRKSLGRFENIADAIQARKNAEEKYFKPMLEKYKDRLKSQEN